jgi:hypothetical protein
VDPCAIGPIGIIFKAIRDTCFPKSLFTAPRKKKEKLKLYCEKNVFV